MEIENIGDTNPSYLTGARELIRPMEPEWDLELPAKALEPESEGEILEEEDLGPEDHIGNFLGIESSLREQAKVSGAIRSISNYLVRNLGCRNPETLLKSFVTLINRFGVDSKSPLNSLFALERRISKNKVLNDRSERIRIQQANNYYSTSEDF